MLRRNVGTATSKSSFWGYRGNEMAKATTPPGSSGTSYLVAGFNFDTITEPELFDFAEGGTTWQLAGSSGTDAAQPGTPAAEPTPKDGA